MLCPPPGDLPDPEIESMSLISPALAGRFLTTSATWEARDYTHENLGKLLFDENAFPKAWGTLTFHSRFLMDVGG